MEGALNQDYRNLEIIISDDASDDGTFEEIQRLAGRYGGPHKLTISRNERNLGLVGNVNRVLSEFVHGEYVLLSGGDDECLPYAVSKAVRMMKLNHVDTMAFNVNVIDSDSRFLRTKDSRTDDDVEVYGLEDYLNGTYRTSGCSRFFKYEMYRRFGPLNVNCQTEDTTTLLRAFLYGKVGYCFCPILNYRIHDSNLSGASSLMTRFDPRRIATQYQDDLRIAFGQGMISEGSYRRLKKKISDYLRFETTLRHIYRIHNKLLQKFFARLCVFSPGFSRQNVQALLQRMWEWQ